jgi:hypothetical protein
MDIFKMSKIDFSKKLFGILRKKYFRIFQNISKYINKYKIFD